MSAKITIEQSKNVTLRYATEHIMHTDEIDGTLLEECFIERDEFGNIVSRINPSVSYYRAYFEYNNKIFEYDPHKQGAITAIRIFEDEKEIAPMAELAFAFGGTAIIHYNNPRERYVYEIGINAYTVIFDERTKDYNSFNNFVK